MAEPKFNLIDEPWIKVMAKDGKEKEVGLFDLFADADEMTAITGETALQATAILRLLVAINVTILYRYGGKAGKESLPSTGEQAIQRFKEVWDDGMFLEPMIKAYFEKWHERFWLIGGDRPFYQVPTDHWKWEVDVQKGDRQHPLWRIDRKGKNTFMLVVSNDKPDFTSFIAQFGFSGRPAQTKDYDPFLEKGFKDGDVMRFHVAANPTVCIDGCRVPLNAKSTEKHSYNAVDWLRDRLTKNGAEVVDVRLNGYDQKAVSGKEKKFSFVQAIYDGILRVEDASKLSDLLKKGIGHEKAYGCGLVSVMPW